MNGFLAALVARTAGQLPVLERRPRSLFEPAACGATAALVERESRPGEMDRTSSLPRETMPTMQPGARDPIAPARTAESETIPNHAGVLAQEPVIATRRSAPQRRDEPPATPHAALAPPTPAERLTLSGVRQAAPPFEPWPAVRPRRQAEAAHGDPPRQLAPAVVEAATPIGTLQPRPTPRAQSIVSLARAQAINAARREAPPAASPAPAPVQISIGRVEIRAVQTSADKPRAVGPAAPRLSLDDYLKHRNDKAAR